MANKRTREENIKKEKERKYLKQLSLMKYFPIFIIIGLALTLMLYLVKFGYIHNTAMNNGAGGTEVSFNGFNIFAAGISGNYSSAEKIFGDISVPFYYYAKSYVETLSIFTVISFFVIPTTIVIGIITFVKKKHGLCCVLTFLTFIETVLLLIIFIMALSMKGSKVLPVYCGGNPACSIRSLAILPFITSLLSLCFCIYYCLKFYSCRKLLI